jgi:hypothetical protein
VSEALKVKSPKLKKRLDGAAKLIDRVHDDGALPALPVDGKAGGSARGEYQYSNFGGIPVRIGVKASGSHPELTYIHEVGHFLDHQALSHPGLWATTGGNPLMSTVLAAMEKTQAVQNLKTRRIATSFSGLGSFLDYLLNPKELWARGYAQYITAKTGDPTLRKQLEEMRAMEPDRQWADEDFAPVLQAIDEAFKVKGWNPI